jgi:fructose-bisphosphate aldolase class 1
MTSGDLERVALTLVADGKGILAADETVPTLSRRFDTLGIKSTEQSRRTYREMLFTSAGAAVLMIHHTVATSATTKTLTTDTRHFFPPRRGTR